MKIPVLFPKIFDYPFTYKSEISEQLNLGDFVKAPFGSTEITGVVWSYEQKTKKKFKIKKISKKINVEKLNPAMIKFISKFFSTTFLFSKHILKDMPKGTRLYFENHDINFIIDGFNFSTSIFFEIFFILNFFSVFCS